MTGRNHTTNGMACITEATSGFPNANGHIPFECANIAEVLGERGWNTYMVGKWHLCAEDEMNLASSKRQWPLGRGFERYYGFLGGETNQWYPDLVYDNHPVSPPAPPEDGYHLTVDLTDKAIEFIGDAKAIAPDKPFLLYYCPGARTRRTMRRRSGPTGTRGKFDMGYEAYREHRVRAPEAARDRPRGRGALADRPVRRHDEPRRQAVVGDRPRAAMGLALRGREAAVRRMAEVYAGFLSHADHELGRLLDYLEETGQLDNTIVVLVSDNGASGEGGPNGSVNENKFFNGIPDTIEENLKYLDELGGTTTYNHYPTGWAWAFNTPFKMWKRYANYEGGTADPLIVSWPERHRAGGRHPAPVQPRGRHRPDALECLGVEMPESVNGYTQKPLEGVSFAGTLRRPGRADPQGDAVLLDARDARRSGTRAGRRRRRCRRPPTRGATSTSSAGSSSTPRPTRARATTSRRSTRRGSRS